jgi:hypothetical protein
VPVEAEFSHLLTLTGEGLVSRWEVHTSRRAAELALAAAQEG